MPDQKNKTGWIYNLRKDELIVIMEENGLDPIGTSDDLRKRLSEFIRENPNRIKTTTLDQPNEHSNTEKKNSQPSTSSASGDSLSTMEIQKVISETVNHVLNQHHPDHDRRPDQNREQPNNPEPNLAHANMGPMEKMRKWNVHFDGGNDALDFLERLEELADCYDVPRDQLLRILPDKLRNRALQWLRNNRDNWQHWEAFCEDFRTFFLPRRYRIKLEDEIRRRTQGTREKGKDFVTHIQTMFRHLGRTDREIELERIYDNLRTEYRMYIKRQDFRTLPELLSLIEQYEDLLKEGQRVTNHVVYNESRCLNPFRNTQERPPPASAQPTETEYNRHTHCWHCKMARANCVCRTGNIDGDQGAERP